MDIRTFSPEAPAPSGVRRPDPRWRYARGALILSSGFLVASAQCYQRWFPATAAPTASVATVASAVGEAIVDAVTR